MGKRHYNVTLSVEMDGTKTIKDETQDIKDMMKKLCLKVLDVKKTLSRRTESQNNSLHKFFELLAEELEEKHIDKREFFKEQFFTSWTKDGVKYDIWHPVQKSLFHKNSTTKLDKLEEINLIWDNINRILIKKYKGEVITPPFPNEDINI